MSDRIQRKRGDKTRLQADNEFNRTVFGNNMHDLTMRVLRMSPSNAAVKIGVGENWMRKMVSKGIARLDPRSRPQLEKVANFFRCEIEDLWKPNLLHSMWVRPDWRSAARDQLINEFHFDEILKQDPAFRKEFEADIEEMQEAEAFAWSKRTAESKPTLTEMLESLLATGRHGFLEGLIAELYRAEKQRTVEA